MKRLLVLFAISGAACLIYEVVWFQLLRLTIGSGTQSLGLLLACFMGGLFVGSLGYARVVPAHWNPLLTYALIELAMAAMGAAMPFLIGWVREIYLDHATSPGMATVLRSLVCTGLLLPPTILMGATLPALARWVRADERQAASIGRLYAANLVGAVAGTLGSALFLLPALGVVGAGLVAAGMNILVAGVAATIRGPYAPLRAAELPHQAHAALPVYLAYGLSGMAALSFEVVWTRVLSMVLGSTVYAFALVLGVFLLALGVGSAVASVFGPRLVRPRRAFAALQLGVVAAIGITPVLVSAVPFWFVGFDARHADNPWLLTLTNLARVTAVVFPGALLWGMAFPLALVSLGHHFGDAARPVGRLYAFNTIGSVLGALAASFLLIPNAGSSTAAAHLVLLPFVAAALVLLPSRGRSWVLAAALVLAAVVVTYLTPWPSDLATLARMALERAREAPWSILLLIYAGAGAVAYLFVRRPKGWVACAAAGGFVIALSTAVPPQLYMLGRSYGGHAAHGRGSEILLVEEGALEPVVVFRAPDRTLQISISGKVCASTSPIDMVVQRLLGHLPVLLSSDPSRCLVVGLGAGITAGAVTVHESVREVDVVELERRVAPATRLFAEANANVLDSPKVRLVIDDGRHWVATTDRTYGVITSDPIEPYLAGAAALYTVEHYQACLSRLADGGVFVQFMGMAGMDEPGVRSLLAAFAQVFPGGSIWTTRQDVVMVGTRGLEQIDLGTIRARLAAEPIAAASLAEVGLRSAEDMLACRLCSLESLSEYLSGATVNTDDRLILQYTGWQAFYSFYDRDVSRMQRLFETFREK